LSKQLLSAHIVYLTIHPNACILVLQMFT